MADNQQPTPGDNDVNIGDKKIHRRAAMRSDIEEATEQVTSAQTRGFRDIIGDASATVRQTAHDLKERTAEAATHLVGQTRNKLHNVKAHNGNTAKTVGLTVAGLGLSSAAIYGGAQLLSQGADARQDEPLAQPVQKIMDDAEAARNLAAQPPSLVKRVDGSWIAELPPEKMESYLKDYHDEREHAHFISDEMQIIIPENARPIDNEYIDFKKSLANEVLFLNPGLGKVNVPTLPDTNTKADITLHPAFLEGRKLEVDIIKDPNTGKPKDVVLKFYRNSDSQLTDSIILIDHARKSFSGANRVSTLSILSKEGEISWSINIAKRSTEKDFHEVVDGINDFTIPQGPYDLSEQGKQTLANRRSQNISELDAKEPLVRPRPKPRPATFTKPKPTIQPRDLKPILPKRESANPANSRSENIAPSR